MTVSGFHTHDGWYWRREADGSVRVIVTETAHAESPVLREHVLPSNEWASVVASVSKRGEDGDTFREAERFHGSAKEEFSDRG